MTDLKIFLADTYALIELIGGNENYKVYLDHILVTTKFNLAELYYHFLHDYNKETADHYLKLYSRFIIPISFKSIRFGMQFKLDYKKEKLGYVDCIGYSLANLLKIKFLTGYQKCEDKKNVDFVK